MIMKSYLDLYSRTSSPKVFVMQILYSYLERLNLQQDSWSELSKSTPMTPSHIPSTSSYKASMLLDLSLLRRQQRTEFWSKKTRNHHLTCLVLPIWKITILRDSHKKGLFGHTTIFFCLFSFPCIQFTTSLNACVLFSSLYCKEFCKKKTYGLNDSLQSLG